jgi:hypothetical protein
MTLQAGRTGERAKAKLVDGADAILWEKLRFQPMIPGKVGREFGEDGACCARKSRLRLFNPLIQASILGSETGMADNILETLQHAIQDVTAPDVRELKVRVASLEKQIASLERQTDAQFKAFSEKTDAQFKSMDAQFKALSGKTDAQFRAIMAAIGESKAQSELTTMRLLSSDSERMTVLESHRTPRQ